MRLVDYAVVEHGPELTPTASEDDLADWTLEAARAVGEEPHSIAAQVGGQALLHITSGACSQNSTPNL